jgi:hypothetical protein
VPGRLFDEAEALAEGQGAQAWLRRVRLKRLAGSERV